MTNKIITLLVVLFSIVSMAQPNKEKVEKVKALKIAYITKELSLSPAEAEKFWPVYNVFDAKQFELRQTKMRRILKRLKDSEMETIDEAEAAKILTQIETIDDELNTIKKKFTREAKEIIGAKKVLLLKKVEDEFTRTLLKQYRGKAE